MKGSHNHKFNKMNKEQWRNNFLKEFPENMWDGTSLQQVILCCTLSSQNENQEQCSLFLHQLIWRIERWGLATSWFSKKLRIRCFKMSSRLKTLNCIQSPNFSGDLVGGGMPYYTFFKFATNLVDLFIYWSHGTSLTCKANVQSDNTSHTWIEIVFANHKKKGWLM